MAIVQTITALPTPPNPATDDSTTFAAKASAFTTALVTFGSQLTQFGTEVNNTQTQMNASQTGAAIGITYTFSTLTAVSDPGSGSLRLSSATQNTSTAMYVSNLAQDLTDWSGVFNQFTASSSTVKGFLKLHKAGDGTKWIAMSYTALTSPAGYRNIVLTVLGSSSANPFANGDSVVLTQQRNGDAASGGGAAISDIINQTQNSGTTAGTGTAFTFSPTTALTAYAANTVHWVKFHAASGNDPTFQISGVATPPNLVKQMADGSYVNIKAGDFPANHTTRVIGLSATQYLVEQLPINPGASDFLVSNFTTDITVGYGDRGKLFVHASADATARTINVAANATTPLPIGFSFNVAVENGAGAVVIAVATDTLLLVGNSATGNRTVSGVGLVTVTKVAATKWLISGGGVS